MNTDCKGIAYTQIPLGRAEDLSNQRYGRLVPKFRVVISSARPQKGTLWLCQCDCGHMIVASTVNLNRGHVKSCGCLRRECELSRLKYKMGDIINGFKFLRRDFSKQTSGGSYYWVVECPHCNKIYSVSPESILHRNVQSCGCLSISKGESSIAHLLDKDGITYKTQVTFPDLISKRGGRLKFDFAIYDERDRLLSLIEYDGEQHFIPKERFGGGNDFQTLQENDVLKNQYCKDKGLILIRIPYTVKDISLNMLLPLGSPFLINREDK